MTVIEQCFSETLPYTFDWTDRLFNADTITSSAWSISSADVTLSSQSFTTTTTSLYLTGGTPGNIYWLTNAVTTAGGVAMKDTVAYLCLYQRLT